MMALVIGTAATVTVSCPSFADSGLVVDEVSTNGPGYDVRTEVSTTDTSGGGSGTSRSGERETTSVEGLDPSDAFAIRNGYRDAADYRCSLIKAGAEGAPDAAQRDQASKLWQSMCASSPSAPSGPDPAVIGRRAALTLTLPSAVPVIAPSHLRNEWHINAVGQPLWISVNDPVTVRTATMSFSGLAVTLRAVRRPLSVDLGDGTRLTCSSTSRWTPSVDPDADSPTCGHRYARRPASGRYTVTARATWDVTWSVGGQSGVVTVVKTGATTIPVKELLSVNVRNP